MKKKIVMGVVGNDVHVVANRLIDISLNQRGFEVFNLGVNTSLEEFIDASIETKADVVLISSLNGEAEGWSRDLPNLKSKYNLSSLFVIGGNLAVGEADPKEIIPKFKSYGFDLVFHQVDLADGLDEMEKYLQEKKK